jgi:hypothetical protein
VRTITYPDFPGSKIETDAQVKATGAYEWNTKIAIKGSYDGPADIVSARDYQLTWASDGKNILESGSSMLESKSGRAVRQVWTSTITPEHGLDQFPQAGEVINISISPFQIDSNSMSYKWDGTVKVRSK